MKFLKPVCSVAFFIIAGIIAHGQKNAKIKPEKCGTMQSLEMQWKANPQLKVQFEAEKRRFNNALRAGFYRLSALRKQQPDGRTMATIPVVFHVVMSNQALVSDAQIQAQLDTLNEDYAGLNGDSVHIPDYFKPFFGHSGLQFCLARQTPDGEPTTGIERTTTSQSTFSSDNYVSSVKHASSGGADGWDPNSYLNIWICTLGDGLLGIGTFPGTTSDDLQGVVVEYRSIPGGVGYPDVNKGKTLTHEIGHYFNLIHTWGDDQGAGENTCSGTDDIDDTPNQSVPDYTCISGIKTDSCTPSGTGIMYQNYMDYTADDCLVMFTVDQVTRMETALVAYRSSLLNSVGCQSPVFYGLDAQLRSINTPSQRVCNIPFTPVITIRNRGAQTLTSLTITTVLDNTTTASSSWTGSLAQLAFTNISLDAITPSSGNHILKVYLSKPNNSTDENMANDSLAINFQYYDPVTAVTESFEGSVFPPAAWDIVNPDNGITWQKVTGVAKTGNASVMINNLDYSAIGQQDYLRLPDANLAGADSAFFSFQVAAATYTDINTSGNTWDTLEVMVSTDCGQSYSSLYKKWGASLVTHTAPQTNAFVPMASEWRKDSINISNYISAGKILLAFRNTTGFENNIYLDDINLRTVTINPNLKSRGFLVTPSPTRGPVTIQFYPQPTNIKGIEIFNINGQKVAETIVNAQSNYYTLDISRCAAGVYIVRVVMGKTVISKKIIKY